MQFVGDTITKIEATRSEKLERPLKIEANVLLTNVEKKELFTAGDTKEGVIVSYKFDVAYGSESGKLSVEGSIFVFGDKKELDLLTKSWKKKDSKLEGGLAIPLMNRAMELAYLTAIPVAKELKLPTPLRMPKFVKGEPEDKDEVKDKNYVG